MLTAIIDSSIEFTAAQAVLEPKQNQRHSRAQASLPLAQPRSFLRRPIARDPLYEQYY
jgi:hypothetical protein